MPEPAGTRGYPKDTTWRPRQESGQEPEVTLWDDGVVGVPSLRLDQPHGQFWQIQVRPNTSPPGLEPSRALFSPCHGTGRCG